MGSFLFLASENGTGTPRLAASGRIFAQGASAMLFSGALHSGIR
jgi:hypothetical protein